MEQSAVTTAGLASVATPSILHLILEADLIVKAVMILLLCASLWCWAVVFEKGFRFARLQRLATAFERNFWSGAPLDDLYRRLGKRPDHPMALMFATAMDEWRESPSSSETAAQASLLERVGRVMSLTMDREVQSLEKHLPSLATIGAVAPFVGLFGTVWGIMNSFQSIAATKNTTLAVVAPGIAEALFATAMGLVAAIPAVVAYNKLSYALDRYAERLSSFTDEFSVVVSRELDAKRFG
ncbi:Cell division and transport-associated protein TolQ [Arboricoccus pini]|uniref:Tol-Pal system protein TolQ n=1 Tax=Arboricoccus pini TaxID=1963835 RepID=A0A212QT37_9PROT|nr:protein TolQ [Arboricoccus pini]SNB62760.1 Cell division and transport-associated protein TolQ [Arboricoccus pini]